MRRPPRWKLLAWGVPAWAIVALLWFLAIREQPAALVIGLGAGIVALALAAGAIWAWVAHNRSLARRREAMRGGRRGAPDVPLQVTSDARGRTVRIHPGARASRIVVARVDGDVKLLAPEDAA